MNLNVPTLRRSLRLAAVLTASTGAVGPVYSHAVGTDEQRSCVAWASTPASPTTSATTTAGIRMQPR